MNRVFQYDLLLLFAFSIYGMTTDSTIAQEKKSPQKSIWISAGDESRVDRIGQWRESRFRYAAASDLVTNSTGAALECRFRGSGVVRFKDGRVTTCTYGGHETAPVPFGREETPPLRVRFSSLNEGTQRDVTATVTNDYLDPFPQCRLTFVMPLGEYKIERGRIESSITSDNKKYTVLTIRTNVPEKKTIEVRVQAQ